MNRLTDYIAALGERVVETIGDPQIEIAGAAGDSRLVQPGDLFVAIPGASQDGAEFAAQAVERGAVAVVAVRLPPLPDGVPVVLVRDAYAAAGVVAEVAAGRPASGLRLLGITGTNGKTTSAYLLRHLLRRAGRTVGMIGTVEYDLGDGRTLDAERTTPTPFELQRLLAGMGEANCTEVVAEASSHALDQRRFGSARFAGALFTNLTGDHRDYHPTEEHYFAAKCRLFEECLAPGAPAVVNLDDSYGVKLLKRLARRPGERSPVTFGFAEEAAVRIVDCRFNLDGLRFGLRTAQGTLSIASPMLGRFNASNIAGVAALALADGFDPALLVAAVADFQGAPGRLQVVSGAGAVRAVVDYAHTDDALKNVLVTLRALKPRRLTVVFGCGGDRDRSKRPRMGKVAAELADRLFVTSDNPRGEPPERIINDICCGIHGPLPCTRLVDRGEAIRIAIAEAQPGELVLIAGKGHENYQEIAGVKHPFDDVEQVRAALAARGM